MAGYRRTQSTAARGALVTPRQAAALDRMAEANGFANGSALLADVASCTVAELGRKPRGVVQMFIDQAFARYGSTPARAATTDPVTGLTCCTHGAASSCPCPCHGNAS